MLKVLISNRIHTYTRMQKNKQLNIETSTERVLICWHFICTIAKRFGYAYKQIIGGIIESNKKWKRNPLHLCKTPWNGYARVDEINCCALHTKNKNKKPNAKCYPALHRQGQSQLINAPFRGFYSSARHFLLLLPTFSLSTLRCVYLPITHTYTHMHNAFIQIIVWILMGIHAPLHIIYL